MSFNNGLSFLSNGLIRLSQSSCLNDPFEMALTDSTNSKLSYQFEGGDGKEYTTSRAVGAESVMKFMGVVSLSETKDNLLMWSHYADSHRGVVIEFDVEESEPFTLFNMPKKSGFSSKWIFERVNYRKTRWLEDPALKSDDDIMKHYILTKSDEWIYEKEHRFILPFDLSKDILIKSDIYNKWYTYLDNRLVDNSSKVMKHVVLPNECDGTDYDEMGLWQSGSEDNNVFMLKINPSKVSAIYIGANCCEYEFAEHFDGDGMKYSKNIASLWQNSRLMNVYKCIPDRNRFEFSYKFIGDRDYVGGISGSEK